MIAFFTVFVTCSVPLRTVAQDPLELRSEGTAEIVRRLEGRLDNLERENQEIRAENARLLDTLESSESEFLQATSPAAMTYLPGEGATISMLNSTSQLTIGARLSALSIFSTKRPVSPGLPLFLNPASPTGQDTNTFDLHARQSVLYGQFTGPEVCGLTPGGALLTLFYNDNLTSDNYGMLLYYAYGELKNDRVRFAAGLQKDIFNPVGPTILPFSLLYGSGNAGSYRGQIRFERYVRSAEDCQWTFQVGLSEPIATLVRDQAIDPLIEDNGWPNIEGRLAIELGATQAFMGGRKQRPFELGVSAVVGQIRTTQRGIITPAPERAVQDIWGLGCDLQWVLTDRFGVKAEVFAGQALGEYNAGVLQNFNSLSFIPIRTQGGYTEIYYYLHPQLHLHCGYGIDDPVNDDLSPGQIACNQTCFNTLMYDFSKTVQIGFEVDYRKTNYTSPLLDSDAVLFMTQFLWRF